MYSLNNCGDMRVSSWYSLPPEGGQSVSRRSTRRDTPHRSDTRPKHREKLDFQRLVDDPPWGGRSSSRFRCSGTCYPPVDKCFFWPPILALPLLSPKGDEREREKGNEHEKGEVAWMEDACSIDQTDAATFATTNLIISVIWLMDWLFI